MDQTDEIKQKIDVVDLISGYLTLQKAGRNWRANCPFHQEKTPSFMVTPDKQIWYCFGCNQGGDIFSFIEKIEGLDFVGALHLLADRAGIILERQNIVQKDHKTRLYAITEIAAKFFHYILLQTSVGREALRYLLEKRKLTEETIEKFNLGYTSHQPVLLRDFLSKKGYSEKEMAEVGLITKNTDGRTVDKFRERIIFPIIGINGKIAGFGGRIFKENNNPKFTPPKYLNSPQSPIYDKSSILYGLDRAKESIRAKDMAIIVEGYLDVISSHQAGVDNVVAASGTALTFEQVKILSRYTKNIAFCFDTDMAGLMAAKRALEMTKSEDIAAKAILIKKAKDPDELIQKNPSFWIDASEHPIDLVEFYYQQISEKNKDGQDLASKKSIASEMIPIIARVADPIEKSYWLKKISQDLGTDEKYIAEALQKVKNPPTRETKKEQSKSQEIILSPEEILLAAMVLYGKVREEILSSIKEDYFTLEKTKNLYKIVEACHNQNIAEEAVFLATIKDNLDNFSAKQEFDLAIFLAQTFFDSLSPNDITKDAKFLVDQLVANYKKRQRQLIEREIVQIGKDDKQKTKELLKKLQELI
ncbi:DNA primase [Candidatus Microgenomates bacterium]|nr:DNA primase [Candidatus Microgenomates bacterium]